MYEHLHLFLFGIYPYIALSVFLMGSLIRFDREQYTWRSGSSQLLRARQLRWGSNLFHVGILFLFAGHFVGLLTPHSVYEHFIGVEAKQMMAIVSGGIAGAIYVSCSGRGGPHFGAPSAELAIVRRALGDVPLVGFFAAGEIARHHLYGYTGVLTVFRSAP